MIMKKLILTLIFLFSAINSSWASTISAQVNRNPVHMDETFTLFLEADGTPDDDPDFSPLENDFEIINQSHSSNVSIINGQYSKRIKWTLVLIARRAGTLTIPSIQFGKDASPSVRLSVKAAGQTKSTTDLDVFMELETQPVKAWVQGQIIVTLRFLSAINLSAFSGFPELKTEGVDSVTEKLGEQKQYQTKRGNRQYLIIEQRYAVFPQKNGTLTIPPIRAEARLAGRSSSRFDPFQRSGQIKRVRSKAKQIKILAVPSDYKAKQWLPAAELQISDEWPEDLTSYKAGEPITRTLTILADGLTSAQLPEFKSLHINDVKQYPDKPSLQDIKKDTGIIGLRQEKIAYIPARAGSYTLPAINISWWNTQAGKQETTSIPAKTIKVVAGDMKAPSVTPADNSETETIISQAQAEIIQQDSESSIWFWSSLLLASGWFITLALWWWQQKRRNQAHSYHHSQAKHQVSVSEAQRKLQQACQSNQPQACKDALLSWAHAIFPERPPNNLGQLGTLLNEPLKSTLNELEASLYSSHSESWQAGDLYQQISDWLKSSQGKRHSSVSSLEPLYK